LCENLEKAKEQNVSVFRNDYESIQIPITELVVGDVYRINAGMVIPADSILVSTGH
jgi:magnesium-transporting ATPase (P-type)